MSHSKNTQAVAKIQELSADLFYKKLREEMDKPLPGEEDFAGDNNFAGNENIADEPDIASYINIAGNENIPGKEFLASEENFAGDINIAGEKNFAGKENLAKNILPAKNSLPVELFAGEEYFAGKEFMAKNILPAKNSLPAKFSLFPNPPDEKNESTAKLVSAGEEFFAGKENLAGYARSKSSSSYYKNKTTTTTGDIPGEEYIAGEKNFAGKEKIASRKVPVENYDVPLLKLASSLKMPSFGMLVALRSVLPPGGGVVRVNAFARSIGMSANNVRTQLEALQNRGLIVTNSGGEEGRWIGFTENCLDSIGNIFFAGEENLAGEKYIAGNEKFAGKKNSAGNINIAGTVDLAGEKKFAGNIFTFPLRAKEFYFACVKAGKAPENFQPAVIRKWIDTAEQEGSEYAVAAVLEFLPSAKTNPSAYLHRMLGEKIKPSVANTNSAKEILEAIGKMNKTIGEEILPKDWVRFAGVLGIRVKMGSVQELASQQTALMARFEKFMAQFER